jgi:hypothetical protein
VSAPLSESRQRDLLPVLIQLFYVVAPLEILMIYAGTTEFTAGMATGAVLGAVGLLLMASSRLTLPWCADRPIAYMFVFLCLGALSTSQTVYGIAAVQRGMINLAAMLAMVSAVFVVKQACVQWPRLFPHVVRITAITTGVAGLTAVFQSFVSNVLQAPELFDLSFINSIWGVTWWRFVPQDGLVRAQGIFGEPSFLAAYVGMAYGLAMTRVGLFGSLWRNSLRPIVPLWAAGGILAGLILSFSAVAFAGLLAAYLGSLATKTTFTARSIFLLVIGTAAAAFIVVLLALQGGGAIVERVTDMVVLAQLGSTEGGNGPDAGVNFTVRVLFLNAYVTLQNLIANPLTGAGVGAHPFAYEALLPSAFTLTQQDVVGLNAMDASALLLRLLSETGVLGTAIFVTALLSAWFRARKIVLAPDRDVSAVGGPELKAIALGLNGSLIGVVTAMMLHIPHYYAAEFWALFALCVAVPAVAATGTRAWHQPGEDDPSRENLASYGAA